MSSAALDAALVRRLGGTSSLAQITLRAMTGDGARRLLAMHIGRVLRRACMDENEEEKKEQDDDKDNDRDDDVEHDKNEEPTDTNNNNTSDCKDSTTTPAIAIDSSMSLSATRCTARALARELGARCAGWPGGDVARLVDHAALAALQVDDDDDDDDEY